MALTPERSVMGPERIELPVPPTVMSEEPEVPLGPIREPSVEEAGITVPGSDPITPRSETVGVTDPKRSTADSGEFN